MDPIVTLSSKGQLVMPKSVRDRHGWKSGDRFHVIDAAGAVILRAVPTVAPGPSAARIFAEIDAVVTAVQPVGMSDADAIADAAHRLAAADAATRSD
jgi:AbrB family looped-hinge helix DNA binding protein